MNDNPQRLTRDQEEILEELRNAVIRALNSSIAPDTIKEMVGSACDEAQERKIGNSASRHFEVSLSPGRRNFWKLFGDYLINDGIHPFKDSKSYRTREIALQTAKDGIDLSVLKSGIGAFDILTGAGYDLPIKPAVVEDATSGAFRAAASIPHAEELLSAMENQFLQHRPILDLIHAIDNSLSDITGVYDKQSIQRSEHPLKVYCYKKLDILNPEKEVPINQIRIINDNLQTHTDGIAGFASEEELGIFIRQINDIKAAYANIKSLNPEVAEKVTEYIKTRADHELVTDPAKGDETVKWIEGYLAQPIGRHIG